jgi:hypothetical protein
MIELLLAILLLSLILADDVKNVPGFEGQSIRRKGKFFGPSMLMVGQWELLDYTILNHATRQS